jgi:predicted amidophosphoribosyltransferase
MTKMKKPMLCEQCNAKLKAGISSCPSCGYSLLPKEPLADGSEKEFSWETSISLFTNPLVQKQMAIAIFGGGLGLALILSFISAIDGDFRAIPTFLLISLIISLGIWLLYMIVLIVFFRQPHASALYDRQ